MFHPKGPTFLELARQAFSSTEKGYDLLAPKFDYTPFCTPEPLLEAAAKVIGGPRSIGSALDVGCGTGAAIRMLRPLCRERVVGIDFSRGMLDVCRERIEAMPGGAEVELVRGDALRTPFSEEFDVAVCFGALGHIVPGDERRFVGQVATTLKPGGRFVFASAVRPRSGRRATCCRVRSTARCTSVTSSIRRRFTCTTCGFCCRRWRACFASTASGSRFSRGSWAGELPSCGWWSPRGSRGARCKCTRFLPRISPLGSPVADTETAPIANGPRV